MPNKPARIYFSFRSPYSWFATRLLRAQGISPSREGFEHIPVWEPDETLAGYLAERGIHFPYSPMVHAKHLYILKDIKRLADRMQVPIRWPIDKNPDWSIPHRVYLALAGRPEQEAFFFRVYESRWEQGLTVWDWQLMQSLLDELQLPAASIIAEAQSDTFLGTRIVDNFRSIYRDDVFGVPYFKSGREGYWGIERMSFFLDTLRGRESRLSWEGFPDEIWSTVEAYARDHAGGCG